MSQQPESVTQSADTEPLNPNFKGLRFRVALGFAIIAAVLTLLAATIIFYGDSDIHLYDGFPEFNRTADNDCNCDTDTDPQSVDQEAEPATISEHLSRMWDNIKDVITEFVKSFDDRHVAGASRFLAVVAILIFTVVTYRALLLDRFQNEARKNMITVFSHSGWHLVGIIFVPIIAAIISYILLTEGWILLADMFEDVKMTALGAIFITTIFVSTITFVVVSWAVAITTRELLMFGLLTIIIGLSAGFAVADGAWWQAAVSEVGKDSETDLLFTITLISTAIIFILLWIDIDQLIRDIVGDKFKLIRALFFIASISLALIGLFPRLGDDSGPYDATYILTFLAHTGGAFAALLIFLFGGMVFFTRWMQRRGVFPRLFTILSLIYVGFAIFEMVAFAIDQMNDPKDVTFINLTAVELIAFIGIGLWLYGALDHLLTYANEQHAEDNPYAGMPTEPGTKSFTERQRQFLKWLASLLDAGDNIEMN